MPAQAIGDPAASDTATFVYECNDDYAFVARREGETIWLFLPGETLSLPHVEAGSGAKYSDGKITFWSKGDRALLETEDGTRRECVNNRAKAIWEHAKLNGVDFRAVGNEPGWSMEIRAGGSISLVTDYGQRQFDFPTPVPLEDRQARTTRYGIETPNHDLLIILEGRPCTDTMSGDQFETSVTVILDGRKLSGCGRPLH
jgi:membrane-bound inhibitor of C-type lysozyme